jgi:hypothetical protein
LVGFTDGARLSAGLTAGVFDSYGLSNHGSTFSRRGGGELRRGGSVRRGDDEYDDDNEGVKPAISPLVMAA